MNEYRKVQNKEKDTMGMKSFKCLLCGNLHLNNIIKDGTRDSNQQVVQCSKCSLVQLFPLPSVEEDAEYYDKNVHDKMTTPTLDVDGIYNKFLYQNENKLRYLEEKLHISRDWKMLDYASGYGFFIQLMNKHGYTFDGLDISKERLSICHARLAESDYNGHIYSTNLLEEDVPLELVGKYDLITMFHLLEHLINPVELLVKVQKMLKPNGILVLELPNYANSMMEISKEFHDFFFIRDHVAYYTPETVKIPLREAGFTDIMVNGVQIYGLTNHMNWILNKGPQLMSPSYESCEGMKWIEKIYRETLENELKSEYMSVIVRNV